MDSDVLSWDAFPEPPPEAKDWVPNPDYIARPGVLKDPRLNKDPQADRQKAARKREARLRGLDELPVVRSPSSSSPSSIPPPTSAHPAWANWPAQIRSSYPTSTAAAVLSHGTSRSNDERAAQASAAQGTATTKSTIQNFPVMPVGTISLGQPESVAPSRNGVPSWAAPLEVSSTYEMCK
jgi:hypothetical protein